MYQTYKEIDGDLISLALANNDIDVIGHGCNCFCRMKRGIAPQMNNIFNCNNPKFYSLEDSKYEGDINKLGQVQSHTFKHIGNRTKDLYVYNLYTQYHWTSTNKEIPLDYESLTISLRKIGILHPGSTISLPKIGCGLAGGDWNIVQGIIKKELKNNNIIIVNYKSTRNEN